ncbi:MAG: GAF domain-containing sensor histidine kinase, partial [Anaerolineales bacterium]|nr:GAF domain-containing sensor histidine kinase [Anaerolineales bacterium]
VGSLFLQPDPSRPLTDEDREIVAAIAQRVSQQVENLRLLADASRARAEAEAATRRLTREAWEAYSKRGSDEMGFVYDSNQVKPLKDAELPQTPALDLPLNVRGETVGSLAVVDKKEISPEAAQLASAIAERVSTQLETLRLADELQKRAAELQTVARLSTTASAALNPDELLQSVVDMTKDRFGLYHAHIYLANDAWNTLLLAAGAGELGRKLVEKQDAIPYDAEKSLVARAARERKTVIVNDARAEPGFLPNPLLPDTRSEMAVPMIVGEQMIGVFDVQSERAHRFSEEDANIYSTLTAQVSVALQNARLYAEQAATVAQLRELDRLKSSFLANMSHELRTPLNSILGFADVILEGLDGPLTDTMDNDLRLIQKNGQHLLNLINDVLDMAKIEAGRMNLNPERFLVHELIADVISIASPLASERDTALFIAPEADLSVEVNADRTRLRQVMINIVNNAIKFTEHGRISVNLTRIPEHALIAVHDNGLGIPPEKLEEIFSEFTQVDTSTTRKVGGTGLGLPISRRLVEMHGGRLWAESSGVPGEGSTFYVELPLEARIAEPIIEKQVH